MKRFFLFIVIIAIIGIGIFILQPPKIDTLEEQDTAAETLESPQIIAAPSTATILAVLPAILGSQFNSATATHTLVNLDNKGGSELIIGAVEHAADLSAKPVTATIQVVTLTDAQGAYKRIGRADYQELMRGVPEVKELRDVNNDGQQDIIMSLLYGGASSWAEGILEVYTSSPKVSWLQLETQQGLVQDATFLLAAAASHWNSVEFKNIDSDSTDELVEIFAQSLPFKEAMNCTINVYKWNGARFVYSKSLSQEGFEKLSSTCEL